MNVKIHPNSHLHLIYTSRYSKCATKDASHAVMPVAEIKQGITFDDTTQMLL